MTTNYCVYYDEAKFKEITNTPVDTQDPECGMTLMLFNILDRNIFDELDELFYEDETLWIVRIEEYFNIDPKAFGGYWYALAPGQFYSYIDSVERMCDGWVIAFTVIHTVNI